MSPGAIRVPSQRPLVAIAKSASLSADNRVIVISYRSLCTDLLEFALQLRNIPKTSAKGLLMKSMRPVIATNRVHSLQMRSVGSHRTSEREKQGKGERTSGEF